MMKHIAFAVCIILFLPSHQTRLCERMTPCDLFRFIRTHKKQISTVDEKTVRVDFLTISLYYQGMDLRKRMDLLEGNATQISAKRNALIEQTIDEDEFDHVDHRGANQHLHQLIMVLRKWLADVRSTLNATYGEARVQSDEIQNLKKIVREEHQRLRALKVVVKNREDEAVPKEEKNDTLADYDNSSHKFNFTGQSGESLFCNGDNGRRYEVLGDDQGISFASAELNTMKASLANLLVLVNDTETNCNSRLSTLASRIDLFRLKLNGLVSK